MKNNFFLLTLLLSLHNLYASPAQLSLYSQTGFEYDSNILKTFDQNRGGFLTRLLFHADGAIIQTTRAKLQFNYNGGGKIFFGNHVQNMLIHSLNMPLAFRISKYHNLTLKTSLKYQNENNDRDSNNLDVNEDYASAYQNISWSIMPTSNHRIKLNASAGYFHFYPRASFSFFSEKVGLEYRYQLKSRIWISTQYALGLQQFRSSERSDTEHEFSIGLHTFIIPYFSLRYQFAINQSTLDLYDSTNHRVSLLISHLFGSRPSEREGSLFSIHFLATLQIRNFPSVTAQTQEGKRFLLTGAEDQNFNHLTLKLAYHPKDRWALESKVSRFSNELSSQNTSFSRNLYYLGLRYTL